MPIKCLSRYIIEDKYCWNYRRSVVNNKTIISSLCILSITMYPPLTPPPSNPHTVVCAHKSFFFLAPLLHPLTHLAPALSLLSFCESVSIFLVSSGCSLDFTCEWNHMVFVFLWLAYFTEHNVCKQDNVVLGNSFPNVLTNRYKNRPAINYL